MAATFPHWSSALARRLSRRTRIALAVSACAHLSVVGALGLVQLNVAAVPPVRSVESGIVPELDRGPLLERVAMQLDPIEDSQQGGSSFETSEVAIATGGGPSFDLETPWTGPGVPTGLPTVAGVSLTERVSPLGGGNGGGSRGSGEGQGIGNGVGDGTGTSFFGLAAQGQKFVFVVDASSSMRRPSFGPERTLFNRVKLEIMRSVRQMTPEQRFFIVFFNDSYFAMPATSLVAAKEDAQTYYLRWMSEVPSGGQTDPEEAMQLALQLQPDVIYFLTDGEFRRGLVKRIAAMNRSGVVIHTINYGSDEEQSETLRDIAEQNGGVYQFVPLPKPAHETAARTTNVPGSATP